MDLRPAEPGDEADVRSFTGEETWPDRETGDYVPDRVGGWVPDPDEGGRTLVADDGDAVRGVIRTVRLTDREAWVHGLRVDPAVRREGVGGRLLRAAFDRARAAGATVARGIVFSWNTASFALSRSVGFEPVTEFRWGRPEPDADAEPALQVTADPDAGWSFWTDSAARDQLRGVALSPAATWAVAELRPGTLRSAAGDGLFVVRSGGTRGVAFRARTDERETDEGTRVVADYGVGAWADLEAARALYDAVARDAAAVGADEARVLVPERARPVTDTAAVGADLSEEPAFVLAADLTDESVGNTEKIGADS